MPERMMGWNSSYLSFGSVHVMTWITVMFFISISLSTPWKLNKLYGPCSTNPCHDHGTCVLTRWPNNQSTTSGKPHFQCICLPGWTGPLCAEDVNDCAGQPCLNGAQCEDRPHMRYVCHCPPGYVGRQCEHQDPCAKQPCLHGGQCEADVLGGFTCRCSKWYRGRRCEMEQDPCYPNSPCLSPGSKCRVIYRQIPERWIDDFQCDCESGFTGLYCGTRVDLCAKNPCLNNATCLNRGSSVLCLCPRGYSGTKCEVRQHQSPIKLQPTTTSRPSWNPRSEMHHCNDCPIHLSGDGHCNLQCLAHGCGGSGEMKDCRVWTSCQPLHTSSSLIPAATIATVPAVTQSWQICAEKFQDGHCDPECDTLSCHRDGFDCLPNSRPCSDPAFCKSHYGDGICHPECLSPECGFDGGDCTVLKSINTNRIGSVEPVEPFNGKHVPSLFLLLLNLTLDEFAPLRSTILADLGMTLRSVVSVWREEASGTEFVASQGSKDEDVKVVIGAWLDGKTNCHRRSCSKNPLAQMTGADVSYYITASLATPRHRSSGVFLSQVSPVADMSRLNFFARPGRSWSKELSSSAVLGRAIKPSKHSQSARVWWPPTLSSVKNQNHIVNDFGGDSVNLVRTRGNHPPPPPPPPPSLHTEHHYLLGRTSIGQPKNEHCYIDPKYEEEEEENMQYLKEEDSLSYLFGPEQTQLNGICTNPLKRYSDCHGGCSAGSGSSEADTPPPKCMRKELERRYSGDGLMLINHLRVTPTPVQSETPIIHEPIETVQTDADKMTEAVYRVLHQHDGLHPLDTSIISNLAHSICTESECFNPGTDLCSKSSTFFPPAQTTTTFVPTGETALHLTGRYNGGKDLVLSIPRWLSTDGPTGLLSFAQRTDQYGRTALTNAAASDAVETATALYQMEREALIQSRLHPVVSSGGTGENAPPTAPRPRRRQRQPGLRQTTPLIAAVQSGNEDLACRLVDDGFPINGVDETGRNVLHWACATNAIIVLQRLSQCRGLHRMINSRDDIDWSPLMLATREGCESAVRFLLQHKASVSLLINEGPDTNPIRIAQEKGFVDIEQILVERLNSERRDMACLPSVVSNGMTVITRDIEAELPTSERLESDEGSGCLAIEVEAPKEYYFQQYPHGALSGDDFQDQFPGSDYEEGFEEEEAGGSDHLIRHVTPLFTNMAPPIGALGYGTCTTLGQ